MLHYNYKLLIIAIQRKNFFTCKTRARIYRKRNLKSDNLIWLFEKYICFIQTHLTYVSPVCWKEPLLSSINDRGCVSGRFQVTQRNRRGAIPCRAAGINRETSLSAVNAAWRQRHNCQSHRFCNCSNPPPLATAPCRGFAPTTACRPAALSLAALRADSLDARDELLEFPFRSWTIGVLRVTSALPLDVALDASLRETRQGNPLPAERCNAIRHAEDNFSRCPSTSMPVAFVRGRAVSRGSGFLEDADYCSSRTARWIYARPMSSRKREDSWKGSPSVVVRSRNAAWNVEIRVRYFCRTNVEVAISKRRSFLTRFHSFASYRFLNAKYADSMIQ